MQTPVVLTEESGSEDILRKKELVCRTLNIADDLFSIASCAVIVNGTLRAEYNAMSSILKPRGLQHCLLLIRQFTKTHFVRTRLLTIREEYHFVRAHFSLILEA